MPAVSVVQLPAYSSQTPPFPPLSGGQTLANTARYEEAALPSAILTAMNPAKGTPGKRTSGEENPVGTTGNGGVEPRFFTLEEVATYLNVSVPQAYALVRSGDLPAIKLGGRGVWRVDRGQLESFVTRLHEETSDWAKKHPLNPRSKA